MRFFTRIAVLFYVLLVMFLTGSILLFVSNYFGLIGYDDVQPIFAAIYYDDDLRLLVGLVAIIILFFNYIFYRMFSVNMHKEKIIAFDNPSGRVTVSLAALEGLIKRNCYKLPEINEVRPQISSVKKSLHVKLRIIFSTEVNIPETTSRVQDMIKRKVQDTIGIDIPVNVTIFVGKILPSQMNNKNSGSHVINETESAEPNIPFRGYGK